MKRVLMFVVLALCGTPTFAEFWAGNDLVNLMRDYEKAASGDKITDYSHATEFRGFVLGVHDSHEGRGEFCSPPKGTVGQIGAVVVKYLNAHPEQWSEPAHTLVLRALKEAFPCPRSR